MVHKGDEKEDTQPSTQPTFQSVGNTLSTTLEQFMTSSQPVEMPMIVMSGDVTALILNDDELDALLAQEEESGNLHSIEEETQSFANQLGTSAGGLVDILTQIGKQTGKTPDQALPDILGPIRDMFVSKLGDEDDKKQANDALNNMMGLASGLLSSLMKPKTPSPNFMNEIFSTLAQPPAAELEELQDDVVDEEENDKLE